MNVSDTDTVCDGNEITASRSLPCNPRRMGKMSDYTLYWLAMKTWHRRWKGALDNPMFPKYRDERSSVFGPSTFASIRQTIRSGPLWIMIRNAFLAKTFQLFVYSLSKLRVEESRRSTRRRKDHKSVQLLRVMVTEEKEKYKMIVTTYFHK